MQMAVPLRASTPATADVFVIVFCQIEVMAATPNGKDWPVSPGTCLR